MSGPELKDGFYEAKIEDAWVEEDTYNRGGIVAVFAVEIEGESYECRHSDGAGDKEARARCEQVFNVLELDFPGGFREISKVKGRAVRVRLKTSEKGKQNSYIATPRRGKVLDLDEINARLGGDDALPF